MSKRANRVIGYRYWSDNSPIFEIAGGAPEPGEGGAPDGQDPAPVDDDAPDGSDGKTYSAEYVKKLRAEAAKARTTAREHAEAARKLAEIEEANKTELQKAIERAETAEKALSSTATETLRLKVAAKHSISGEYLDLLHGSDEESLEANAAKLAPLIEGTKPKHVPRQGDAPSSDKTNASADEREAVAQLFGGGN